MDARRNRRRSRVVDWGFQLGLAVRLLLVLTTLLAAGMVLAFAPSLYVLATTNDLKSLEPAAEELLILHRRLWPAAVLTFAGLFVYIILLSHRIAGPVYRTGEILRALLEDRDPPAVQFREDDFFQPVARLLGELSEKMRASRGRGPARPDRLSEPPAS